MARIPFNVSARTALLIGRENVSNAEGAIIELVKNAHDADASLAVVFFEGDTLYIIDNGHGMMEEIIKNQWMTIGTDAKEVDPYSPARRVKAGAKGIGRFALDRLGAKAEMYTLPKGEKMGYRWEVNWAEFEPRGITIDQVQATIETLASLDLEEKLPAGAWRTGAQIGFPRGGTILKISALRDRWTDEKLGELYRSLETLVPAAEEGSFNVELHAPASGETLGAVRPLIDNAFDCKISAAYDAGSRKVQVTIERNEFDIGDLEKRYGSVFEEENMRQQQYGLMTFKSGSFSQSYHLTEIMKGFQDTDGLLDEIGNFHFDLSFAKISPPNKEDLLKYPYKNVDYAVRKAWLRDFGGIRLFRDNFRVRPYGEKGDDWLQLGKRAAGSPAGPGQRLGGYKFRPSQLVGTVRISRLSNAAFQDKSSREGIQENEVFSLFREILVSIIALLERDRNIIFYSLSELFERTDPDAIRAAAAKEAAKRIKEEGTEKVDKDDATTVLEAFENTERKFEDLLKENQLLKSLASAGIVTAAAAHELKGLEDFLRTRNDELRGLLSRYLPISSLDSVKPALNPYVLLEEMKATDESLHEWISYALIPLRRDRRSAKSIYLKSYLDSLKDTWKHLLEHRSIELDVSSFDENFKVRAFAIDLDTIFYNLIINSVESFERSKNPGVRLIEIGCVQDGDSFKIAYKDNGAGLDSTYKESPRQIFEAQETTKRNGKGEIIGTGMGMYLVKSVLDENKGRIEIVPAASGFSLEIFLRAYSS